MLTMLSTLCLGVLAFSVQPLLTSAASPVVFSVNLTRQIWPKFQSVNPYNSTNTVSHRKHDPILQVLSSVGPTVRSCLLL